MDSSRKLVRAQILFTFTALIFFSIWWLAFYPASISYDSLQQWRQIQHFNFSLHHPLAHTVAMYALTRLWNSPAIVSLLQILAAAGLAGLFAGRLYIRHTGSPAVIIGMAIFVLSPVVGINNVTIWKDTAYSLGILWLCYCWYDDFTSNRINILRLIAATLVASLMRHNGTIYLGVVPILYYCLSVISKKQLLLIITVPAFASFFISTICQSAIPVDPSSARYGNSQVIIQYIAAALNYGKPLSNSELNVIAQLSDPAELQRRYHCASAESLWLNNTSWNFDAFRSDTFYQSLRLVGYQVAQDNVMAIIKDRLCMARHLLGFDDPALEYRYHDYIVDNDFGLKPAGPVALNTGLRLLLQESSLFPFRYLFWNHGLYLLAWFGVAALAIRAKNIVLCGISLLVLVNVPVVLAAAPSRDFRYLLMLPYILPFAIMLLPLNRINTTFSKRVKTAQLQHSATEQCATHD